MDLRQLKTDFQEGRVSADDVFDILDKLDRTVQRL
jgi:hypothetical protein